MLRWLVDDRPPILQLTGQDLDCRYSPMEPGSHTSAPVATLGNYANNCSNVAFTLCALDSGSRRSLPVPARQTRSWRSTSARCPLRPNARKCNCRDRRQAPYRAGRLRDTPPPLARRGASLCLSRRRAANQGSDKFSWLFFGKQIVESMFELSMNRSAGLQTRPVEGTDSCRVGDRRSFARFMVPMHAQSERRLSMNRPVGAPGLQLVGRVPRPGVPSSWSQCAPILAWGLSMNLVWIGAQPSGCFNAGFAADRRSGVNAGPRTPPATCGCAVRSRAFPAEH